MEIVVLPLVLKPESRCVQKLLTSHRGFVVGIHHRRTQLSPTHVEPSSPHAKESTIDPHGGTADACGAIVDAREVVFVDTHVDGDFPGHAEPAYEALPHKLLYGPKCYLR